MSRHASYSLTAADDPEQLDHFYNDATPPQPALNARSFLPIPANAAVSATRRDAFSMSSAGATSTKPTTPKPMQPAAYATDAISRAMRSAWSRLSPSQYNIYFQLTAADLATRIARALFPHRRLFEPPPPPLPPPPSVSEVDGADADDADNDAAEAAADAARVASVASTRPFNTEIDLYGPVWLTATLVLSIAVSANALEAIRVLSGHSMRDLSALTALDIRHLTQACVLVYTYALAGAAATIAAKRYYGDAENTGIAHALCIYGYAATPLIPAVLLCAIPLHWAHWLFIAIAVIISSRFLFLNLWQRKPTVAVDETATSYGVDDLRAGAPHNLRWMQAACVVANALYGVVLKLRFF